MLNIHAFHCFPCHQMASVASLFYRNVGMDCRGAGGSTSDYWRNFSISLGSRGHRLGESSVGEHGGTLLKRTHRIRKQSVWDFILGWVLGVKPMWFSKVTPAVVSCRCAGVTMLYHHASPLLLPPAHPILPASSSLQPLLCLFPNRTWRFHWLESFFSQDSFMVQSPLPQGSPPDLPG